MYKTMTISTDKENECHHNHLSSVGTFPRKSKTALEFTVSSLNNRTMKLKKRTNQEIEQNTTIVKELNKTFRTYIDRSSQDLQERAQTLQAFQHDMMEVCRRKSPEISLQDREFIEVFHSERVGGKIGSLVDEMSRRKEYLGRENHRIDNKISDLSSNLSQVQKQSEESMYMLVGDCQSQMDTLQQRISQFQRKSTHNLDSLEDAIEQLCENLDGKINNECFASRRENELIENLIEKLIHRMGAL